MLIYGDKRSGNCYKLQLLLALLGKACEWIDVDILKGECRTDAFLAKSPNGKIPILELDDGRVLSESNAIMHYLASGSTFIPTSPFTFATLLQWQFFEQYSHEPYIAVARYINLYLGLPEDKKAEYEAKQAGGYRALEVMDKQLSQTPFLLGNHVSLADISLFAYTHVAHEGGFDLAAYPAIRNWITLIKDQKGFIPMDA
ncbi:MULTISPECIES: glutathione S-transferase family protein [Alteromonas]|jgi:glutathione S-transferase|uniref:Glutathione S-transferase n=1 Tax=Alteromonas stellipolaris TaxID=233316 RepID=A0AAW7YYZ6_9ALTE|nr:MULTISPECIES: glutathione S-transferase family protein [Alteromonas]AMJ92486.1 glutathione S-transferase [Alteromonas sp. Mac2]ALM92541.1 Glutathione S-transferase [Alteromonas stellipolaris LMG 21856]AMJ76200.1 glutathione S-transferase [Alteromonas stellipolaris]AMJ88630.1 glutathione S-transferase [Alteromonas sp. Mac1]AMJ96336.1 glutathione S-transferase [Alteromonas stellipolaris]